MGPSSILSVIHTVTTDTMHSASSVTVKLSQSHQAVACVVGYKFLDCFGIDIWNISTGSCQCYLPFGQYGQLLQMEVKSYGLFTFTDPDSNSDIFPLVGS